MDPISSSTTSIRLRSYPQKLSLQKRYNSKSKDSLKRRIDKNTQQLNRLKDKIDKTVNQSYNFEPGRQERDEKFKRLFTDFYRDMRKGDHVVDNSSRELTKTLHYKDITGNDGEFKRELERILDKCGGFNAQFLKALRANGKKFRSGEINRRTRDGYWLNLPIVSMVFPRSYDTIKYIISDFLSSAWLKEDIHRIRDCIRENIPIDRPIDQNPDIDLWERAKKEGAWQKIYDKVLSDRNRKQLKTDIYKTASSIGLSYLTKNPRYGTLQAVKTCSNAIGRYLDPEGKSKEIALLKLLTNNATSHAMGLCKEDLLKSVAVDLFAFLATTDNSCRKKECLISCGAALLKGGLSLDKKRLIATILGLIVSEATETLPQADKSELYLAFRGIATNTDLHSHAIDKGLEYAFNKQEVKDLNKQKPKQKTAEPDADKPERPSDESPQEDNPTKPVEKVDPSNDVKEKTRTVQKAPPSSPIHFEPQTASLSFSMECHKVKKREKEYLIYSYDSQIDEKKQIGRFSSRDSAQEFLNKNEEYISRLNRQNQQIAETKDYYCALGISPDTVAGLQPIEPLYVSISAYGDVSDVYQGNQRIFRKSWINGGYNALKIATDLMDHHLSANDQVIGVFREDNNFTLQIARGEVSQQEVTSVKQTLQQKKTEREDAAQSFERRYQKFQETKRGRDHTKLKQAIERLNRANEEEINAYNRCYELQGVDYKIEIPTPIKTPSKESLGQKIKVWIRNNVSISGEVNVISISGSNNPPPSIIHIKVGDKKASPLPSTASVETAPKTPQDTPDRSVLQKQGTFKTDTRDSSENTKPKRTVSEPHESINHPQTIEDKPKKESNGPFFGFPMKYRPINPTQGIDNPDSKNGRLETVIGEIFAPMSSAKTGRNPENRPPYLGRSVSHFDRGRFSAQVEKNPKKIPFSTPEFTIGFAKGLPKGVYESGKGVVLFFEDMVTHPVRTATQMCDALSTLARLAHDDRWGVIGEALSPEIHQLVTKWDTLPSDKRGELAGYALGKHGADILAPGAIAKIASKSAKSVKELTAVLKNLQKAEGTLVLETTAGVGNAAEVGKMGAFLGEELGFNAKKIEQLQKAGRLEQAIDGACKSRLAKTPSKAYVTAKNGENHARIITEFSGKPIKEIQKSIRSYEKLIVEHKDKISKPANYCQDWNTFHPNRQQAIVDRVPIRLQEFSKDLRPLKVIDNPKYRTGIVSETTVVKLTERQITKIEPMKLSVNYDRFNKYSPKIDHLKRIHDSPRSFYRALRREFHPQKLDEPKIRRILSYAGYHTYKRPSGLPSDVVAEFSKKNGGMIYRHPGTKEKQNLVVRVCPGLAKESIVSSVIKEKHLNEQMRGTLRQQYPYVVQMKGKEYLTTSGDWVNEVGPTTHIPLEIYEFKGWK
ncbi:MAG: hypothetical protein AAGE99_03995 [Chlamydiota bacterium]